MAGRQFSLKLSTFTVGESRGCYEFCIIVKALLFPYTSVRWLQLLLCCNYVTQIEQTTAAMACSSMAAEQVFRIMPSIYVILVKRTMGLVKQRW